MAAQSNIVYDALASFEAGINSGVSAYRLPKNQLPFAVNSTVRGDYATDRPPFIQRELIFSNPATQKPFETGLFQGSCYYQPDAGAQQIICSISGRIYRITPAGNTATVDDITIPNDPNSGIQPQSWLWQSERWVIIQNGLNDPIFYDGISCRRSQTTSKTVGTVDVAGFIAPAIGSSVVIPLTAPFTGIINNSVYVNGTDILYVVTKIGGSPQINKVVLKHLAGGEAGQTISDKTQILIQPSNLGYQVGGNFTEFTGGFFFGTTVFPYALPASVIVGTQLKSANSNIWTVTQISADRKTITVKSPPPNTNLGGSGSEEIFIFGNNAPNVVAAFVGADFVIPVQNQNVEVLIDQQFTQPNGTIVFIGSGEYQVISSSSVVTPGANTITATNINDTDGTNHASGELITSIPELPAGRMGDYGMGRNWLCLLDGISYIASDIVGGSSGSPAYNYRDAVLKVTENTYLAGGGSFRVPGAGQQIAAMKFSAILDTSLGQGNLQIFTNENAFSNNTPTDRTTWQNLTNPIQTESLIGSGAAGQNCVVRINGDLIFRSPNPNGIRSMLLARLDFNRWGNTPNSHEVERIIQSENVAGLPFCSSIQFDNRLLMTANHFQSNQGVYGQGIIALNFDPNSSLAGKEPSVYDGLWTGLNTLQLLTGNFNGQPRAFALCLNAAISPNAIQIFEILKTGSSHYDNGITPIQWVLECPILFKDVKGKGYFDLIKLLDGEIYVSDLIGKCDFKIEYRPDFSNCWYEWYSWSVCADSGSTVPQYRSRMGFGEPSNKDCQSGTNIPARIGRWFQLRITITGHCVVMGVKVKASIESESDVAKQICNK